MPDKVRRRINLREGDFVQIDLGGGQACYGRVLKNPLMAFYDLLAAKPIAIEDVGVQPVLFRIWVMNYAVKKGRWPIIGHLPLERDLLEPPRFFKVDPISKRLFIYSNSGKDESASHQECRGLERAAVWDPEHVEDRLRDHFAGRPNKWAESLRLPREV
jgi:hypothetical protein